MSRHLPWSLQELDGIAWDAPEDIRRRLAEWQQRWVARCDIQSTTTEEFLVRANDEQLAEMLDHRAAYARQQLGKEVADAHASGSQFFPPGNGHVQTFSLVVLRKEPAP